MRECILATRSAGKIAELVPMLAAHGIAAMGLDAAGVQYAAEEECIEAFDTFTENAIAKARYFAERTRRPCVADDSGLCVDVLDGAPGVRSRRFAADRGMLPAPGRDEDACNNEALIRACRESGHAAPWSAHFVCAAVLVDGESTVVAEGRTDGVITPVRDGAGGFGYDPHFVSAELGVSFASASREAKARVSHRARALKALLDRLANDASGGAAC